MGTKAVALTYHTIHPHMTKRAKQATQSGTKSNRFYIYSLLVGTLRVLTPLSLTLLVGLTTTYDLVV